MASNSGDSHEHHGSLSTTNKLNVLILGSEWESSKGGPSTINREFAIHLAKHSKVHVTFLVPQCSDRDKSAANAYNIDLREAEQFDGMSELQWLCFPPHDLHIDIVIGHGAKLGPQANAIKMTRGNCRWVQFVHTAPEELGMHKEYPKPISSGQEKHNTEVKLCEKADFVVTVGPKLNKAFRSYLSSCKKDQNVYCFTPGLFSEFSEIVQVPERSGNFQVLLVGRGDAEDFSLKGFDIAAEAIALLANTDLYFIGALEGEQDATAKRFLDKGIPTDALYVRKFSNRESLKKCFIKWILPYCLPEQEVSD